MEELKVQKEPIVGLENASDEIKMAIQGKEKILEQGLVNLSITTTSDDYVKISIETPEGKHRIGNDIVCVLDVSGSMGTLAQVKNTEGVKEQHGLTYLDLLKHAARTCIQNLTEQDRFSLVSYSDYVQIDFELQTMTEENKQIAFKAVEGLSLQGCTNIWGGVETGLEILRQNVKTKEGQHQSVILLTDGEPNVLPKGGNIFAFKEYMSKHPDFKFSLNSFAFGKNIDTPLLDQFATLGNGQYSFIPCPGFIGTIFVNSISNILNTMGGNCELKLEFKNGVSMDHIPGEIPFETSQKDQIVKINVGDIKFGQFRDIVIKLNIPQQVKNDKNIPFMNTTVKYFDYVNKKDRTGYSEDVRMQEFVDPLAISHVCRSVFVEKVQKAVKLYRKKKEQDSRDTIENLSEYLAQKLTILKDLEDQIEDNDNDPNQEFLLGRVNWAQKFINNIKKDVDGEVTLAVKHSGAYNHWGKHFLPSLCHAHLKQQCNNFCDPGIQEYGGQFFNIIKDQVEQSFLKLPAPKPSKKYEYQQNNANQSYQQPQKVVQQQQQQQPVQQQQDDEPDMGDYYNCGGGGCFEGNCLVQMFDGSFKKVKDIKKGDQIAVKNCNLKSYHTVLAAIKISSVQKINQMVTLPGGLIITPKHPIKIENQWVKPLQVGKIENIKCSEVYNFVLMPEQHTMIINGIECITLGHQIMDKNAFHPYFGSNLVIQDLKSVQNGQSFKNGLVEVWMHEFQRNTLNKQVCGLNIQPICTDKQIQIVQ